MTAVDVVDGDVSADATTSLAGTPLAITTVGDYTITYAPCPTPPPTTPSSLTPLRACYVQRGDGAPVVASKRACLAAVTKQGSGCSRARACMCTHACLVARPPASQRNLGPRRGGGGLGDDGQAYQTGIRPRP